MSDSTTNLLFIHHHSILRCLTQHPPPRKSLIHCWMYSYQEYPHPCSCRHCHYPHTRPGSHHPCPHSNLQFHLLGCFSNSTSTSWIIFGTRCFPSLNHRHATDWTQGIASSSSSLCVSDTIIITATVQCNPKRFEPGIFRIILPKMLAKKACTWVNMRARGKTKKGTSFLCSSMFLPAM